MKNAWLFLFILLLHSSLSLKCNPQDDDRCFCVPGVDDFEFQCRPPSESDDLMIIHITKNSTIQIDCPFGLEKFEVNFLPNVTVHNIQRFFRMRSCPLPPHNFKEIVDHFKVVPPFKDLQYLNFNLSNVKLSKTYFQGLEFLESIELNKNYLVELEADVFEDLVNLTSLELQGNRIVLTKNFFRYTPLLKSLDLAENQLENIPDGVFQGLDKLGLLHLWGNRLTSITDTTFDGLLSLKSLELSSNNIQNISEKAFASLINLLRLNLSINQLKTLQPNTLQYNTKLERVVINHNFNLTLPDYFFSNLTQLKMVEIMNSKLRTLPKHLFAGSKSLETLKLGENELTELPEGIFSDLRKLEKLTLEKNRLVHLGNVFANLRNLKILNLHGNEIVEIHEEAFKDLVSLEEIYLHENKITTIHNNAFSTNNNLKIIDLFKNYYAGSYSNQFVLLENVPNIESVDLSHNKIVQIGDVIPLYNKVKLRSLDLSHNNITDVTIKDLQPLAKKLVVNLQYNNIRTVSFHLVDAITQHVQDAFSSTEQSNAVIYLSHNPLDCDCNNHDLVKYFQDDLEPQVRAMFDIKSEGVKCAAPPALEDFDVPSLPQILLLCSFEKMLQGKACPQHSSCSWRPHDQSLILDFSNKNLTHLPELNLNEIQLDFNQTEVHLEGNNLTRLDTNFTSYGNVTKLYLSGNKIREVQWLPRRLQLLHLDHNKIEYFAPEVLQNLNTSHLKNLTLQENPWRCDCDNQNLTTFLRQHTKVVDTTHVFCSNSRQRLIDLNRNDLCETFSIAVVAVGVLMFLLIIAVLTIMYFHYQQPLKVWLYSNNLCLWWVTEEELDKDKIYDAFISYSHKDEDFVTQNLIPVLEGNPNPYKLCLHYRDWVPGEFILTQVTKSVLDSRRTLVVLSPNFLDSVWGKAEFRTAHTQAMTEGRARVIIVLLGDIDVEKLDDELKAYMKTNTYVQWGDPYFWRKLKYALPHSRIRSSNSNQKIANVISCIDDKFNLVAPVTNPGSTPPVLSLDPHVLKKDPLNFVPRTEINPSAESRNLLVSTGL